MMRLVDSPRLYPGSCAVYPQLGAAAGPFLDTGRTTPAGEHVYISAVAGGEIARAFGFVRMDAQLEARERVIDRLEGRVRALEAEVGEQRRVVEAARTLQVVAEAVA